MTLSIRGTWAAPLLLLVACSSTPEPDPAGDGVAPVGTSLTPSAPVALAIAASSEPDVGPVLPDGVARRQVAQWLGQVIQRGGVETPKVAILDAPDLVARALPGGYVQVSRGALAALDDPDPARTAELVTALGAFLAGHFAERHPERLVAEGLRAQGFDALPTTLQGVLDASDPDRARSLGLAYRLTRAARYDADACDAADARAVGILRKLRVSPEALVRLFERFEALDPRDRRGFEWRHHALALRRRHTLDLLQGLRVPAADPRTQPLSLELGDLGAPNPDLARAEAASLLVRRGLPDLALEVLGDAQGRAALRARSDALRAADRPDEAERPLRDLLVLDPHDVRARLALARLYIESGRTEVARRELERALQAAPLRPDAHYYLALIEDDPALLQRRCELVVALDGPEGPWTAQANRLLLPDDSGPRLPDPNRTRILGGG